MHLTKEDIFKTPRIKRLNLINSITGIKPANLIGTKSSEGITNLAIFSTVVHLGSHPALLGFFLRPHTEVRRDTYENILETKHYTFNHVHPQFVSKAHYTSAKFDSQDSEFEKCQLTEEYIDGFDAPFVKESHLKIGLKLEEVVPITINQCSLFIGSIEHITIDDTCLNENYEIDLQKLQSVGIGGLNRYYSLKGIDNLPYARVNELPEFNSQ